MWVEPSESGARPLRLHALDALRSVLMLLGVVLHAAYPYGQSADWLVRDSHRSALMDGLIDSIHFFRMPAFFVIAGCFSLMLLWRQGSAGGFLRERSRRIGVPLLATLLSFNLVQTWLLAGRPSLHSILLSAQVLGEEWTSGRVMGHLWFLVYLLVFCAGVAVLARPLARLSASRFPARLAGNRGFPLLLAVATGSGLGMVSIAYLAGPWFNHEYWGVLNPPELISYLPYFGIGLLLGMEESLLLRFSSPGLGMGLLGLASLAAMSLSAEGAGLLVKSVHVLATSLSTWAVLRFLFAAFRRWAGAPSRLFRYLSDASYSVYLMHHLFVVALATALLGLDWAPAWKFLLTCSLALGCCLAIHHFLVLRHPLLALLFNGKRRRAATPIRPAPGDSTLASR
ncbi:MAG: hypothetical protein EOP92_28910 [Lysobacteraceae bacterium]|nr:MAG: hypothetical protein EOP92_28910 [Xanthomonadaceae bacterium]